MLINYFYLFLVGLSSSAISTFLLKKISLKNSFLTRGGISLIGGLAIWLSFTLGLFLFYPGRFTYQIMGVFLGSLLILISGLIDDQRELSIAAKFIIQFIAASLMIFSGTRAQIAFLPSALNIIISYLWIIGITNALNHLDVIDGLAGATTVIVGSAFFAVSLINRQPGAAVFSMCLSAAALGFLFYNFPPASVYMGNSGSHFCGFILAAVSLIISFAPLEREIALLSPLLIIGLPILDTAFLIVIRVCKKKIPFKKSNDHLPLRLLALGYSRKKALTVMLLWCLLLSISGMLVSQMPNLQGLALSAILVFICILMLKKMSAVRVNE